VDRDEWLMTQQTVTRTQPRMNEICLSRRRSCRRRSFDARPDDDTANYGGIGMRWIGHEIAETGCR